MYIYIIHYTLLYYTKPFFPCRNYIYFTDLPEHYYTTEDTFAPSHTSSSARITTIEKAAPSENGSLIVMKMRGKKATPHHIKQRIKTAQIISQVIDPECCTPCPNNEPDNSPERKKDSLNCPQKSGRRSRVVASSMSRSAVNTISMKMSSIESRGEAYALGNGLPEEKASYLEVTSQS